MSRSPDELIGIKNLPEFLRTDHCFNDLQHSMLVILFRHLLSALKDHKVRLADMYFDSVTLYLYIHFLNEEEGMVFNMTRDLIDRDNLAAHSERHIYFLEYWKNEVLIPYKSEKLSVEASLQAVADYYDRIIVHIDGEDQSFYGQKSALDEYQVRTELARVAQSGMPMSPFMAGALATVRHLDATVADALDKALLSPQALLPLGRLSLVPDVGRILDDTKGSLRDRFAASTHDTENERTPRPGWAA